MKLVDLSQPFDPALFPRKPGAAAVTVEVRPRRTIERDGVNTCEIAFDGHVGTHIDAPRHLDPAGRTIDELPLDAFYGPAAVLDLPRGPNGAITAADLASATPRVLPGDVVLVRTGWADRLTEPAYASHHPYLSDDAAAWLLERRARLVGMDVQSVDLPHSLRGEGFRYTSLRTLLEGGIPVALNLRRLEAVAGRRVTVLALPIPFAGAEGAPARVVALLD
ncbi:MAG: cyclase family protein [Chloroflexota bacterium]|nr:cyclase family protein [Chloroflexota bacterium]